MLRTLALSALTLLALDGLSTVLAPATGVSLTSEAAAADFTGRIKNVRIRKRRTGSGFKVVARTGGDSAESVASAEITLSNATTGEIIDELVLDEGLRGKQVFTGQLDGLTDNGGGTVTLVFNLTDEIDSNGDPFGEQQEFEVSVDGLDVKPAEDTTADGWKVRVRANTSGQLTVVLGNEDKNWGGGATVEVSASVDGGEATELGLDEVRQRFASNIDDEFDWDEEGGYTPDERIQLDATLYDVDGNVLDTLSQLVSHPDELDEPALGSATLKETRSGVAKLVSYTDSDGQPASLEVELTNSETGETVIQTTDDTPVSSARSFNTALIEFDPGEDPGDYIYLGLIDLIDDNGDPTGDQMEVELTVPTYDAETDTPGEAWQTITDADGVAVGTIGFYASQDGVGMAMAYQGEDTRSVASANIIFEEPYEGPAPLETEVNLEFVAQADKWLQKGDSAVPDFYSLTTSLVTPDGTELDSLTATGEGTGTVYKTDGNGKGTRKGIKCHCPVHLELL